MSRLGRKISALRRRVRVDRGPLHRSTGFPFSAVKSFYSTKEVGGGMALALQHRLPVLSRDHTSMSRLSEELVVSRARQKKRGGL